MQLRQCLVAKKTMRIDPEFSLCGYNAHYNKSINMTAEPLAGIGFRFSGSLAFYWRLAIWG
jgi:hypothetical protein